MPCWKEEEEAEAINTLAIAEFGGESVQNARDKHVLTATCRDRTHRFILSLQDSNYLYTLLQRIKN